MPLFRKQFSDLELRNASYNIAKLISFAQQKAVGESKFYKLNFDYSKGSYALSVGEKLGKFEKLKTRYGKVYSLPANVSASGKENSFIFYPNGTSDKIELIIRGQRSGFKLKSKGRLGHVKIERIGIKE